MSTVQRSRNRYVATSSVLAGTGLTLAVTLLAGCGSTGSAAVSSAPANVQQYFAPAIAAIPSSASTPAIGTYVFDHTTNTFTQNVLLNPQSGINGVGVYDSGTFVQLPDGISSIGLTYYGGSGSQGILYDPPLPGSYAIEWQGQGGLVGLLGQPVTPIAPNQVCPDISSAESFEFVTLPNSGDSTGVAYGTLKIATAGPAISFSSIAQFNIAGGAPTNPSVASVAGTCATTVLGQTISVPSTVTVTNPGNGQQVTPSATIAIGPTGFLVEDSGGGENVMGAANGAIGLPMSTSALATSSLTGASYTGFIYSTGAAGNNIKNLSTVPSASRIASFGYPNLQTACPNLPAPQTGTIIYGGEFAGNNPVVNSHGNCDFAVDLGAQSTQTNGLYPAATITIGASYPGNTTGKNYSFGGVAITAQLEGKNAIFVIGLDTVGLKTASQGQQSQDWGVYLLQSN